MTQNPVLVAAHRLDGPAVFAQDLFGRHRSNVGLRLALGRHPKTGQAVTDSLSRAIPGGLVCAKLLL